MISTKEQAAETCIQLSVVAAKLIYQLNHMPPLQSQVNHFYEGVLVRTGVHLKDAATILRTNRDEHISTAFVIFRVLLDDLLRSSYVYASTNRQLAIDALTSKAQSDFYNTWKVAGQLNAELQLGDAMTEAIADAERDKFLNDAASASYITLDRSGNNTFKKGVQTSEMVRTIKTCPRVAKYSRGYVLYKHMSHYVHYSMLPHELDRAQLSRALEIQFIDEVMFLAYHMIKVAQEVLAETNTQMTWPTGPADASFGSESYSVHPAPTP